jgi:hypothetical protein
LNLKAELRRAAEAAAMEHALTKHAWNAAQVRRVLLEAPPQEQPLPFRAAA